MLCALGLRSYFGLHSFMTWKAMWCCCGIWEICSTPSAAPTIGLCFQGFSLEPLRTRKIHPADPAPPCSQGQQFSGCPLAHRSGKANRELWVGWQDSGILPASLPQFHQISFHSQQIGTFVPALSTSPGAQRLRCEWV